MQSVLDRSSLYERSQRNLKNQSNRKQVDFIKSKEDDIPPLIRQTKEELAPVRQSLPIYEYRDALIHAVETNTNIVVVGETGSGKTTQVPQYLYEAGLVSQDPSIYSSIAITQPRRVAAMTLAERVSQEVGTELGDGVGYTIRFDDKSCARTKLKFLTDGMLLRELQIDPKLTRYKIIVLDEAHERTLNTDVLFGLLKTLQLTTRPDLKLVVMSATLDADKFSTYLNNAPVALIPGRTHPVDVYYLDRDAIDEEFKKDEVNLTDSNDLVAKTVMQLHQDKPLDGDILVFMPGSDDIENVKEILETRANLLLEKHKLEQEQRWLEYQVKMKTLHGNKSKSKKLPKSMNNNGSDTEKPSQSPTNLFLEHEIDQDILDSLEFQSLQEFVAANNVLPPPGLHILSLYSTLAPELQLLAFRPAPEGTRKVILSTNIAETSVTVSGVKYVIDTGLAKVKEYIHGSGVGSLKSHVISRAEAQQRTGRAGREQPGECYRLYTEDAFENEWEQTPKPEIARATLTATILSLKSLHIDIRDFPLIDTPSVEAIKAGYKELLQCHALTKSTQPGMTKDGLELTELGRLMSTFPIEPVFSRLLITSARPELLWLTESPGLFGQSANLANPNDKKGQTVINKKTQQAELAQSKKYLEELTMTEIQRVLNKDAGDIDAGILSQPCSEEMCILIAALSVENLVKTIPDTPANRALKYKIETLQQEHYSPYGDLFFVFNILRDFLFLNTHEKRFEYCRKYYYNYRNLNHALNIYQQLCELVLESGLPLVSTLQTIKPKKSYTYAQFLRNRANTAPDSNSNATESTDAKKKGSRTERSAAIQKYLDDNAASGYNYLDDEVDFDRIGEQKKMKKKGQGVGGGNNNNNNDEDEVDWEENMAKCLTAAFHTKLVTMNDSSKYEDHVSGKRVDIHPSSMMNFYFKREQDQWKEKKAQKQANQQQKQDKRYKDLQQLNASAHHNSALQEANMTKVGHGGVPNRFKDYTTYSHICYYELIDTSKLYMRGIFRTKPEWLHVYSRGSYKPDATTDLLLEAAASHANGHHPLQHDTKNTQLHGGYFGTKAAYSNLTGKTLAHTVALGAGQKALGLKKTVIDANQISNDGKPQKRSLLSIGVGSSQSFQGKKHQSGMPHGNGQAVVSLALDQQPTQFKKGGKK
jgi:HrpA-like RNA helicase